MSEFISNITFGPSKADQTLETIEAIWNLPSETEHCCIHSEELCPQFRDPRVCAACDSWLWE